jgi:hypothetical protein
VRRTLGPNSWRILRNATRSPDRFCFDEVRLWTTRDREHWAGLIGRGLIAEREEEPGKFRLTPAGFVAADLGVYEPPPAAATNS